MLVRLGGVAIGGLVGLAFKDRLVVPWSTCRQEYFSLCPNVLPVTGRRSRPAPSTDSHGSTSAVHRDSARIASSGNGAPEGAALLVRIPIGAPLSESDSALQGAPRCSQGGTSRDGHAPRSVLLSAGIDPINLRVAFIGAGQMTRDQCSPSAIRALGRLVGVQIRSGSRRPSRGARRTLTLPGACADRRNAARRGPRLHATPGMSRRQRRALDGGAHVYVEKPFAPTTDDARTLLDWRARGTARLRRPSVARDRAFERAGGARPRSRRPRAGRQPFRVPSSGRQGATRRSARARGDSASTCCRTRSTPLIAVLERLGPACAAVESTGRAQGRSPRDPRRRRRSSAGCRSPCGRPVASSRDGDRDPRRADLRPGALDCRRHGQPRHRSARESADPDRRGDAARVRGRRSVGARVRRACSYPGLAEMIDASTALVAAALRRSARAPSLRVTGRLRRACRHIDAATAAVARPHPKGAQRRTQSSRRPTGGRVVTGARGFLGATRAALGRVRGIGRSATPGNPHVHAWIAADLEPGCLPARWPAPRRGPRRGGNVRRLRRAPAEHHRRDTPPVACDARGRGLSAGAGQQPLCAAPAADAVGATARAHAAPGDAARFGAYSWGETRAGRLVDREAPALGIAVRIVRPGALVDWTDPVAARPDGTASFRPLAPRARAATPADRRVRRRPVRRGDRVVHDAFRRRAADREPVRSGGDHARGVRGAAPRSRLDGSDRVGADQCAWRCAIVIGACAAVDSARPVAVAVRRLVDPAAAPLRRSDCDEGVGRVPMTVFVTDGDQRPGAGDRPRARTPRTDRDRRRRSAGQPGRFVAILHPGRHLSVARSRSRRVRSIPPGVHRPGTDRRRDPGHRCDHTRGLRQPGGLAPPLRAGRPAARGLRAGDEQGAAARYAGRCGVPVPRTLVVDGRAQLPEVIDRVRYPAVVKPVHSRVRTRRGMARRQRPLRLLARRARGVVRRDTTISPSTRR